VEKGNVSLFAAEAGKLENHAQLVARGLAGKDAQGFSLFVKDGKIVQLNRISQLNSASADYKLPKETATQILKQLGAPEAKIAGD
jgi:hypothetical protein